jgi:hypothetical protein
VATIALAPLRAPLPCWHESVYSARTDSIVALSLGGAFLQTQRPLPLGAAVFLELLRPGSDVRIEVDAEVVGGDLFGQTGFAVRFLRAEQNLLGLIDELLSVGLTHFLPGAADHTPDPFDKRAKTEPFGVPPELLGLEPVRTEVTERFIRAVPTVRIDTPMVPELSPSVDVEQLVAVDFDDLASTLGAALPRRPSDMQLQALTPPMPQVGQPGLAAVPRAIPAPIEGWLRMTPEPMSVHMPTPEPATTPAPITSKLEAADFEVDVDFDIDVD